MAEILGAMSWQLWAACYIVVGLVWAVIEQLVYEDYLFFEFLLCTFLWLPRLFFWVLYLFFRASEEFFIRVFAWAERWTG